MNEHISFDDLSRRTDDLLPPARRDEVDAHLAVCEACRREYETLLWINKSVKSVPWHPIPPGVSFHVPVEENRVRAALRRLGWGRTVAFAAMPAVLLLFIGALYCGSPAGGEYCPAPVRSALGRPGGIQPAGSEAVRTSVAVQRIVTRIPRDELQPTVGLESTPATEEPDEEPVIVVTGAASTETPELEEIGPGPAVGPGGVVAGGEDNGSDLVTGGESSPGVMTAQAGAWLTLTPASTSTVTPTVTATSTFVPPGGLSPDAAPQGRSVGPTTLEGLSYSPLPEAAAETGLMIVGSEGSRADRAIVISLADDAQGGHAKGQGSTLSAAPERRGSGISPAVEITALGDVFLTLAADIAPWHASSLTATSPSTSTVQGEAMAADGGEEAGNDGGPPVAALRQTDAGSIAEAAPRPPGPAHDESGEGEPTATQPGLTDRVSPLFVLIVAVVSFLVGRIAPAEPRTGLGKRRASLNDSTTPAPEPAGDSRSGISDHRRREIA